MRQQAADGSGIALLEILPRYQRAPRGKERGRQEGKDLEAQATCGDEVLGDEAIANCEVLVERHFEERRDAILAVEADAVAIGGQDEE